MKSNPGIEYALGTRIAHLLAGGYDRKSRTIPPKVRDFVKARDKVCVTCGEPGKEIDHISGSSNDPDNLQFLCKRCHHDKTDSRLIPASAEADKMIRFVELTRIRPEVPRQLCDDPSWATVERKLKSERRLELAGPRKRKSRSSLRTEDVEFI